MTQTFQRRRPQHSHAYITKTVNTCTFPLKNRLMGMGKKNSITNEYIVIIIIDFLTREINCKTQILKRLPVRLLTY